MKACVFAQALLLSVFVGGALLAGAEESDQGAAEETGDSPSQTVEEILARDPESDDYIDEDRCIRTNLIRSVDVIDDKHISFRVGRNDYYLVQFERRCPGLRRGKPVMYEANTGRLCRLDGIRTLYETGMGGYRPGMRCSIPEFRSVTKEQLVLLKDALKVERRKKRES